MSLVFISPDAYTTMSLHTTGYSPSSRQGKSPSQGQGQEGSGISFAPASRARAACRVVIVDDHQAVRELLRDALVQGAHFHYEVAGLGGSKKEALELCRRLQPDLLILEMILPDGSGTDVVDRLRRERPGQRVVFFTGCEQVSLVAQAIGMGASGYVLKSRPLQTLIEALARVRAGGTSIDPALLIEQPKEGGSGPSVRLLTPRERQVVRLIAQGKTTKEAAVALGVSAKTLDKHRSNLMRKLGVHDVVGVTRYALSSGLIALN